MPQVPYSPIQSVTPSDTPMAYSQVRPDPNAFGAGVGRALSGLSEELNQLSAYAEARSKQQQGYERLTSFYQFQNEVDTEYQKAERGAPANGNGFEASWTANYDAREKQLLSGMTEDEQKRTMPQLMQLRGNYQKKAFLKQFALQDQNAANGINDTLNKARVDLDQNPANLQKWYASLDAQIDASTLPEVNKAEAKRQLRPVLQLNTYNAEARGNPDFAQSALGVVPKGGYRTSAEDQQLLPGARDVLTSRLSKDKDPLQHVDKMQPRFANSLARLMESMPELGIYSGARSRERQQQLWDESDKSGVMVGHPDGSLHVKGNAADLSWNGKRLDEAPKEVQDRVRLAASQYGLAFPLDTPERRARGKAEPWHIEDAQARQRMASPGTSVESKIIAAESGGNPNAANPGSSARGLGQFTEETWLGTVKTYAPELMEGMSRAQVLALRNNPQIARQMLTAHTNENKRELRSAGYEQTDANVYLLHFLGKNGGLNLLRADPMMPVSAVLDSSQIAANRSVLEGKTVGQVREWAARKMAGAPSMGADRTYYASRPADPRFADIPFDTRVSATNDALAAIDAQALRDTTAAAKAQQAQLNDLLVGIHDGRDGMEQQYQAMRQSGAITSIDDINKVDAAFKARQGKVGDLQDSVNWLGNPNRSNDPLDADNKKRVNSLFGGVSGTDGQRALQNMDQDFVNTGLIPLLRRTGMIPSDAMGTLSGLVRSNDPNKFAWAMGVADQLDRNNHLAFSGTAGEEMEKALNFWRARSGYANKEQMLEQWNDYRDPAKAGALDRLREDGKKLAKEIDNSAILDHFDTSWTSDPGLPAEPQAIGQLRTEFENLFADAYTLSGDPKLAQTVALTKLSELWGTSEVGGTWRLMKYPPNNPKYYAPVAGSYAWMDQQLRDESAMDLQKVGVPIDAPISLVADPNTAAEVASGAKPGYRRVTVDRNGLYTVLPGRYHFDQAAAQATLGPAFDAQQAQQVRENQILRDPNIPARLRGPLAAKTRRDNPAVQPQPGPVEEGFSNPMGDNF